MKKIFFLFLLFLIPLITFGAGLVPCGPDQNPCTACDILVMIENILHFALDSGVLIIVGTIMYGGLKWVLSGGEEKNIQKGKKIIQSAIIGLIIVLASYIIINTTFWIIAQLGGDNYVDNWFQIECNSNPAANLNNNEGWNDAGAGQLNNYNNYNNTGGGALNNFTKWCGDLTTDSGSSFACVKTPDNCREFLRLTNSDLHCPDDAPICCVPKSDDVVVSKPQNPNLNNQGGPCQDGKLLTLCRDFSECTSHQCPNQPIQIWCSKGDVMRCPEECHHLCDTNEQCIEKYKNK